MFWEIDPHKKPIKPQLFISKPNREIIGKLSEAYNVNHTIKLVELNEIEFDIPYEVQVNNVIIDNNNLTKIKNKYLILVKLGELQEWYTITNISDRSDDQKEVKHISATSIPYDLRYKLIRDVQLESKNAKEALNIVLGSTLWSINYLDADFELTYRDFDFSSVTVLDAINVIANTFNAIIRWNTVNMTIDLVKPEFLGVNRGLKFSYGHYLKTLDKEVNTDEMATRLKVFGKDGLSIESVNDTGQNYLENFNYFIYPFERDANRNVLKHSDYMSDDLCHSLLDYNELIDGLKGQFSSLLSQKESLISQRSTREAEMASLRNDEKIITDIQTLQQFDERMWFYKEIYNGSSRLFTTQINPQLSYVVLCKVQSDVNISVSLDGINRNVYANQWTVLGKVTLSNFIMVEVSGTSLNNEVFIQIANITENEYSASSNEAALIEKYSLNNKEMQIQIKQNELNVLQNQIDSVDSQINTLKDTVAPENNFSSVLLQELNQFVIEKEFIDENYVDPKELYDAAKEKFKELQIPQLSIDIDIVNFLEVIEEQHNWSKLNLGDDVIIDYKRMGVKVSAKIIEIALDYEGYTINLTISNVKEIDDENKYFKDFMNKSMNTSTAVDLSKNKWTQTIHSTGEISQILEHFWDKVTNEVNTAANEFVTYDRTGITIKDPNDPLRFLRATHGALAITRSGGIRYETAITADGIIAERLMGKILLTERVVIGDDDGIWTTTGAKTDIVDRCGRNVMKIGLYDTTPDKFGILLNRYASEDCSSNDVINQVILDRDEGFKITQWNGVEFVNKLYADVNGLLWAEDMTTKRLRILSDTNELMLDSFTKYMDIGKFENIITDGKLTAIEKLQVKGERERIMSEYTKLLAQIDIYRVTTRDNTIRIDGTNYTNSYNELMVYLAPLLADMDETSAIDRNEFIAKFKSYYDETVNIINAINASIKYSSLQLGSYYNNIVFDAINGITVTRSDNLYQTRLNATEGISISKDDNGTWVKKFYVNLDGRLQAEDLVAKRLQILNDLDDPILDADTNYLNIGKFDTIITDGKLTPIEKLTLKQEWETIQTEYAKLKYQAEQYEYSDRDGRTISHITIPPFTSAYVALGNYVTPLLADMSATTPVDRDEFKTKFQAYYDEAKRIINEITNALKYSSLLFGIEYTNKIKIDAITGFEATRSDNLYKTVINATEGIAIKKNVSGNWVNKFYVNLEGFLQAEDLVAKRLQIINGNDNIMLDANTNYLNIGRFETIITDGKLTPIEKLTLKQEWETIQTEYVKLLNRANQYRYSARDNNTISHIDIPPFTAAYNTLNAYVNPLISNMSTTTSVDRTVFKNTFQAYYDQAQRIINEITNVMKYSSLQFNTNYNNTIIDAINGVTVTRNDGLIQTRMNATEGISITRGGVPKFYVDTNGILHTEDLVAKRLRITADPIGGSTQDTLLIDADTRTMYLNNMNLIGAGVITGQQLLVNNIFANEGTVNDLMVNRLRTMKKNPNVSETVDYIDVQDNYVKFITATISSRTHARADNNELLYWTDSSMKYQTFEETSYPVYQYEVNNIQEKVIDTFLGSGANANPFRVRGAGDGATSVTVDSVQYDSARAYEYKYNGGFIQRYLSSNYGMNRSITMMDTGILIEAEEELIDNQSKNFRIKTETGYIKLEHSSGAIVQINDTGTEISATLSNNSKFSLSDSGLDADIQGSISLKSTGAIEISAGQAIDINTPQSLTLQGGNIHFNP